MIKNLIFIAAIAGLTSCGTADIFVSGRVNIPPGERVPQRPLPPEKSNGRYVSKKLFIPPGHLPPQGACKIWAPGTPPGHQSPPEACESAFYYVQPGQMIVRRDDHDPKLIEVSTAYVRNNKLFFNVDYYFVK